METSLCSQELVLSRVESVQECRQLINSLKRNIFFLAASVARQERQARWSGHISQNFISRIVQILELEHSLMTSLSVLTNQRRVEWRLTNKRWELWVRGVVASAMTQLSTQSTHSSVHTTVADLHNLTTIQWYLLRDCYQDTEIIHSILTTSTSPQVGHHHHHQWYIMSIVRIVHYTDQYSITVYCCIMYHIATIHKI